MTSRAESAAVAGCGTLEERLFANFIDGTLANAVERLAQEASDSVERSCLYEAAEKLRAGARLYEALMLVSRNSGKLSHMDWQQVERTLAKARGETLWLS
jgi:hypothetical protein